MKNAKYVRILNCAGAAAEDGVRQEMQESLAPVVNFSNAPTPGLPTVMEFEGDAELDMDEIFGKVNASGTGDNG